MSPEAQSGTGGSTTEPHPGTDGSTTELHPSTGIVFDRRGQGPPLVLIHGLGSNRHVWDPVLVDLAAERDVVLVDLPGFGETPPLPRDVAPTAHAFAHAMVELLDDLGLSRPHIAGHSLGGWVALEIAARGRASSVTAVAPAGLWGRNLPLTSDFALRTLHRLARGLEPVTPTLARSRAARTLVLWPQSGRPWAAPAPDVVAQARSFARSPGFDRTIKAISDDRFTGAPGLDIPVTVAFGTRDLLLDRWQSQRHSLLPPSTRWITLHGCGHIPQWDDPAALTRVLLFGSSPPLRTTRHPRAGVSR